MRSMLSHSFSFVDQLSASKNQGVNASRRIEGASSVLMHPKTSRMASCSSTKREGERWSRGESTRRAWAPPMRVIRERTEVMSECQASSAAKDYPDQRCSRIKIDSR